jgi:hypothetical protein
MLVGARAHAQCVEQWLPAPGIVPGAITEAVLDDPDGAGPDPGRIVFLSGGRLHAWNGATVTELSPAVISSSFGNGLAVYQGDIYVAGFFTSIGGVPASCIARFDGTQWHDVHSGPGEFNFVTGGVSPAYSLKVYSGELYFGGTFNTSGGPPASRIIRWDGTQWRSLGGNAPSGFSVLTLEEVGGELWVGGEFPNVPGVPGTTSLAVWNGSSWSGAGLPFGSLSYTTEVGSHNGTVWTHGVYLDPTNRVVVGQVFRRNGAAWESPPGGSIGGGPQPWIQQFTEYRGRLAMGGLFANAGALSGVNSVAFHSGTAWGRAQAGVGVLSSAHGVYALVPYRDELHVFGNFTLVNGVPRNSWARWSEGPPIITAQPQDVALTFCDATRSFSATVTGASGYRWRRDGVEIFDGLTGTGGVYTGTDTPALTILDPAQGDAGVYACAAHNACGVTVSAGAALRACAIDFNCDGFVDFFDYDEYVACYEGGACPATPDADFNGDGFVDFFDYDAFVEAYERGC